MTNDREQLAQQLSAFLDGQLPPEQAEQLAAAVEKDPLLRQELRGLQATRALLKSLPREAAPPALLAGVMEQVERDRLLSSPGAGRKNQPLRWVRYTATAAVLILGVGLGMYIYIAISRPSKLDELAGSPPPSRPQALVAKHLGEANRNEPLASRAPVEGVGRADQPAVADKLYAGKPAPNAEAKDELSKTALKWKETRWPRDCPPAGPGGLSAAPWRWATGSS